MRERERERERDMESKKDPHSTKKLIKHQQSDPELISLLKHYVNQAAKVLTYLFLHESGMLMCKWRPLIVSPDEEWKVSHQLRTVVSKFYHEDVLSLAHELPLSRHLGISKTYQKVLSHFYWPGLHRDVVKFYRACQTCQVVGKPILSPFCKNFLAIMEPLTNLLYKHREFQWSAESQTAFQKVRGILTHHLVLAAPDFTKPLK